VLGFLVPRPVAREPARAVPALSAL